MVFLLGLMEECIKATTVRIKSKVMASSHGKMVEFMLVAGIKANNMDMGRFTITMVRLNKVYG